MVCSWLVIATFPSFRIIQDPHVQNAPDKHTTFCATSRLSSWHLTPFPSERRANVFISRSFSTHRVQHGTSWILSLTVLLSTFRVSHPSLSVMSWTHLQHTCLLWPPPPHTHTLGTLTHCTKPLILTFFKSIWVKEILFGFLFSSRCSVRQLLWWWDTKTTPPANVHMGGRSLEFMFVIVCVCVWCIIACHEVTWGDLKGFSWMG